MFVEGIKEYCGSYLFSTGVFSSRKTLLSSLTDIDGLESSAIGGQLMASASTESPFTQGRRIDDCTVAGNDLYLRFMDTCIICVTSN